MLSRKAKLKRDKIKIHIARTRKHSESGSEQGEGFGETVKSIGNAIGSAAKTAAPHLAAGAKYVAKHADSWAPPLLNAGSQLIAAKARSKALDIDKEIDKLIKSREAERKKLDNQNDTLTKDEMDRLLKEFSMETALPSQGSGLGKRTKKGKGAPNAAQRAVTTGYISGKASERKRAGGSGLYLPGTTNAPVSAATMQGLSQTVQGRGLEQIYKAMAAASSRPGII